MHSGGVKNFVVMGTPAIAKLITQRIPVLAPFSNQIAAAVGIAAKGVVDMLDDVHIQDFGKMPAFKPERIQRDIIHHYESQP